MHAEMRRRRIIQLNGAEVACHLHLYNLTAFVENYSLNKDVETGLKLRFKGKPVENGFW